MGDMIAQCRTCEPPWWGHCPACEMPRRDRMKSRDPAEVPAPPSLPQPLSLPRPQEEGHSSRFGAALSEGVSADDGGRSAVGPRRCMGYLWIVGGRRAGRMSFVTFWGGSLVVDGARVFSIILIYPLAGRRGARRCRPCHPRRREEGRPGHEDVGGQLWSLRWRPCGSREDR